MEQEVSKLAGSSVAHWVDVWQPGLGQIVAQLLAPPPVHIRQEIGMIVNEQRSILDSLSCKLAIRNGANNINDVYFPIVRSKKDFFDKLCQTKLRKLDASDRLAIEKLKPWHPSEEDPDDGNLTLFQLHTADKVRKHQDLRKRPA